MSADGSSAIEDEPHTVGFPLPDYILERALSGSRKVASNPRRGAFGCTQLEIIAMAHLIGIAFDPQQAEYLTRLYESETGIQLGPLDDPEIERRDDGSKPL